MLASERKRTPGMLEALICLCLCFLASFAMALLLTLITHQSLLDTTGTGILLVYLLWCIYNFLIIYPRDKATRGEVILDCGPNTTRYAHIGIGIVFSYQFLFFTGKEGPLTKYLGIVCAIVIIISWLLIALERIQIFSHGIWYQYRLYNWEKIKSYRWIDSVLEIEICSKIRFMNIVTINIPAESKLAVSNLLREHLPAEAEL